MTGLLVVVFMIYTMPATAGQRFHDDSEEQFKRHFDGHGVSGIDDVFKSKLDEWKQIPLNIAITGNSGTGKSSFINAIRGLTADDEGAAAVGVTETTKTPTPYKHPHNHNMTFWDLPGVDTMNFPRDQYLDRVKFDRYDIFLIFASERFRESDSWLAKMIKDKGKGFYLVRTKIDSDIENDKRSHPRTSVEMTVIERIRKSCDEKLRKSGIQDVDMFILSNHNPHKWDFPKLSMRLIHDMPKHKREAMVYSLNALTRKQVIQKRESLESRMTVVALLSGLGGAIPVPMLSIAVDVALLVHEATFYSNVFGLDKESLDKRDQNSGRRGSKTSLWSTVGLPTFTKFCTREGIQSLLVRYGSRVVAEEGARTIPMIGLGLSAKLSYELTLLVLNDIADSMEESAYKVIEIAIKNASPESQAFLPRTEL